jgi:hypothetical protein
MTDTHLKTLLVIVAEGALEKPLVRDARQRGVRSWTVSEVHGGAREGVRDGYWEADRTVELKLVCDPDVAQALAEHVMKAYAPHYSVSLYFSDVRVIRADRY